MSPVFRSKVSCCNSSVVEHFLGKEEVLSSTLSYSSLTGESEKKTIITGFFIKV